MLITRHFVFVHQQKTGGVFVKNLVRLHHPEWIVSNDDMHPRASEIPQEFSELPRLGFVRNPWDWYVSWWHWVRSRQWDDQPRNSLWVKVFDEGRASFSEMVGTACSLGPDVYTRLHREVFDGPVEIGRFENLREDLLAFLERHEVPVSEEFRKAVEFRPPDNSSRRLHYSRYYDPQLRDLVRESCPLVQEYGYDYEGSVVVAPTPAASWT